MEIKDLITLMWRGAKFLVMGFLLGMAIGLAAAKFQSPVYESTTKLLVSRSRQQSGTDMLTLSDEQLLAINLQLVKSQPVLDDVSSKVGAKIDPDAIQATAIPNTLILQIKVQDADPKQAAAIANTLVETLIQKNETLLVDRYSASENAITVQLGQVETQITELQKEVSQANDASVQQQLTQVNLQINLLSEEIAALEKEVASFSLTLTPVQSAALSEKQAQLVQLRSLLSLYQQIQTNLTYIGKPGQSGLSRDNPVLSGLQSTLDLYQQMHLSLISDLETIRLARMQNKQNLVQLVSAIPPKKPAQPMTTLYILLGGLVGLSLAATSILMLDHFDDTLKTAQQTEELLGLPTLGLVSDARHSRSGLVNLREPVSPELEAFRSLGVSIQLVHAEKKPQTLMIVNAGALDGKSTIAANLAIVNAQRGKKVILLDADLKHPHLHDLFGMENHKGLANIFEDGLDAKAAGHAVQDVAGLTLIPVGVAEKETTGWLDAEKWWWILFEMRELADLVIVDAPSSAESADSQILASKVDSVLLAVHLGKTKSDAARVTLKRLQLVRARVTGVILFRTTKKWPVDFQGSNWVKSKLFKKELVPEAGSEINIASI